MTSVIVGWIIAFFWVFSFPFLFFIHLALTRAVSCLLKGKLMNIDGMYDEFLDKYDDFNFFGLHLLGTVIAPVSCLLLLAMILAKSIAFGIAIRTNRKIEMDIIIKGVKK